MVALSGQELLKNTFDNEYRFESQKAIFFLTLGTITTLTFITAMFLEQKFLAAVGGGTLLVSASFSLYKRTRHRLDQLLMAIERLQP